jgi:hypothetical protein
MAVQFFSQRQPLVHERNVSDGRATHRTTSDRHRGRAVESLEQHHLSGAVADVDCGLMTGNIVMARELTLENR